MEAGRLKNYLNIAAALILAVLSAIEARERNDFDIFLRASEDLFSGKNIYEEHYRVWYHYFYSTFFAIVIYPLSLIHHYWSGFIWLCIQSFALFRIARLLNGFFDFSYWSEKLKITLNILCWLMVIRFLRDNFHLGQLTILMLWICLESVQLAIQGKNFSGGFLLALGINIKILPIVLIPYFIYRRKFKLLGFTTIGLFLLFLIPVLFIGFDQQSFLFGERFKLLDPFSDEHVFDVTERSYHSLTTLLATLFSADARGFHSMELRRHLIDLPREWVHFVIHSVRIALVMSTVLFLKWPPFKDFRSNSHTVLELSYILALVPLIFPHQLQYAFLFLLPAIYCLFYWVMSNWSTNKNIINKKQKALWIITGTVVFFLLNGSFILGTLNAYYNHFKTLTYGALMIVILLFWVRRSSFFST